MSDDDEMGLLGPHRQMEELPYTARNTMFSLRDNRSSALCVPVYSQPVRIDLLVAVHLGT